MNRDEHEEEDRNSNTSPRREDDRQGDLSKVIADLERRCTYMEMVRNDKSKTIVVDKLLRGTNKANKFYYKPKENYFRILY
jgi:hypothetical protein